MTTSLLVTTALHFVLLYHYATTYWFYLTDTKERMYAARLYTFGGEYKYLTIWTMVRSIVYCIPIFLCAPYFRAVQQHTYIVRPTSF